MRRRAGELFDRAEMSGSAQRPGSAGIGTAPGRRAAVHRVGVHGDFTRRVRGAIRHRVRLVVEVLQRRQRRHPRGPAALLEGMFHVRRMFGGALWNAWPFALLARHYAEGFVERLTSAVAVSEEAMRGLAGPRDRGPAGAERIEHLQ